MTAIEITSFGGRGVLQLRERPKPEPGSDEVLIRVKAAGVARADVLQRQGKYPPPRVRPIFPGWTLPAQWKRPAAKRVTGSREIVCAPS